MLAINGGTPVRKRDSWPKWPEVGPDTLAGLERVLQSGRWSISGFWTGKRTEEEEFADQFAAYHGVPHCIPTANGSSSLLIALEALNVGFGDEVIVPGLTWVAPATAVVNVNAIPIPVDIDPCTFCLSTDAVADAMSPRTRGVIAVHSYCSMADLDALRVLCDRTSVALIEDCAQSHGAVWRGQMAGTIGDIGVFSMHHGKPLSSGEGGATITSDPRLAARMEQLRANGRRWLKSPPPLGHGALDEIGEILGSNYALSEFQAAVLCDALGKLDDQNTRRATNAKYLDQSLAKQGAWLPVERLLGVDRPTYYHYLFRCRLDRLAGRSLEAIALALEAELGFWVHRIYPPLTQHPLYKPQTRRRSEINSEYWKALDVSRFELPHAEKAHAECLVFHHSVLLGSREDMDAIVEAFDKIQRFADEIPTP